MGQKLYWYFSANNKKLRHGDNRQIRLGRTHKVDYEPVLCESGLHASLRAIDALWYAPGPVVWRVTLSGSVVTGDDKCCATERTYVSGGIDASDTLRLFARQCALDVVHLWGAPRVVLDFLNTGDEKLRASAMDAARASATYAARDAGTYAARDAATYAAMDAATYAAMDAATYAAWYAATYAARASARDAARASARYAAWYAATYAARASARDAARASARDAARASARDAAMDAATDAQNKRLTRLLTKAIKDASP